MRQVLLHQGLAAPAPRELQQASAVHDVREELFEYEFVEKRMYPFIRALSETSLNMPPINS